MLTHDEQLAFASAARVLRFGDAEGNRDGRSNPNLRRIMADTAVVPQPVTGAAAPPHSA